ncbi:MAG: DDE-type integrase/transposase/recombinase [Halanaeroarchaeum sp.]
MALDETVVKVNDERFWLYSAVDVETNVILYLALYPSRTTALTKVFLRELKEKHDVDDADFFVVVRPDCMPGCSNSACIFAMKRLVNVIPSDISFKG